MVPQQYCLRWKHHHSNVQNMFAQLLEKERFCDVTLYCSPSFGAQVPNKDTVEPQSIRGVSLRAHRVVLAACSELLGTLLGAHEAHGEPVLVIDGAEPKHLKALLDYMYTGEMNVHHSQLASLLKTAEELRIKGLTDIRWNNKDEPPDCASGAVATTTVPKQDTDTQKNTEIQPEKKLPEKQKLPELKQKLEKKIEKKMEKKSPERLTVTDLQLSEPRTVKEEFDRSNVNGGPPPLIKLPIPRSISTPKREHSDSESLSPKRRRLVSGLQTEDESNGIKIEREEWQHGNMDISASRVNWGGDSAESRDSEDEWADAPADIGSFLHTRLRVDGDNSADEESNDSSQPSIVREVSRASVAAPAPTPPVKLDLSSEAPYKPTVGPKSGPTDSRFTDVVKLNEYLQHGRRPQFWEENYVKRVMEAVRLKELEMKQAAEILGVSYGTLYGRYRDVYGCINRPYRARDFWQVKGPSEVLERLQRAEISLDTAATALGVSAANLAAHIQDFPSPGVNNTDSGEFEPIPIEVDPMLRTRNFNTKSTPKKLLNDKLEPGQTILNEFGRPLAKIAPKVIKRQGSNASDDDEAIPANIISTEEAQSPTSHTPGTKWPAIRVASIDSLRSEMPSASQLMRTRPDLTIVAKKNDGDDT